MSIQPEEGSNNLCEMGHLSKPKRSEPCGSSIRFDRVIQYPNDGFPARLNQTISAGPWQPISFLQWYTGLPSVLLLHSNLRLCEDIYLFIFIQPYGDFHSKLE